MNNGNSAAMDILLNIRAHGGGIDEAIAMLSVCADGGKDSSDAEPVAYLSTEPRNWGGSRIKPQGTFTIPVYTRPQPRYLTDEEIEEISHQRETWSVVEFGRALINAAITKEKK